MYKANHGAEESLTKDVEKFYAEWRIHSGIYERALDMGLGRGTLKTNNSQEDPTQSLASPLFNTPLTNL